MKIVRFFVILGMINGFLCVVNFFLGNLVVGSSMALITVSCFLMSVRKGAINED